MKKTLKDYNFKNKRVLIRVDFNVPLENGVVADNTRINAALPTIKFLINEGAKLILMSHLGRPKGEVIDSLRMDPVAKELANLLRKEVIKVDDCIGEEVHKAISQLASGELMLLENTRFYKEEKTNDKEFSKKLAELADIYVNDAFGAAHRAHASTVGVAEFLPSAAGFLMKRELNVLGEVVESPEHPFVAIMGGAKVSDKIGVIKNILGKIDYLLLGGGIANTFLSARGYNMEKSLVESEKLDLAREVLGDAEDKGVTIVLPEDMIAASEFKEDADTKIVTADNIPEGWQVLDSGGPLTLDEFATVLNKAKTVIWNGPIGVFEYEKFATGTNKLAEILSSSDARTIIGGGDSTAAIKKAGLEDNIYHISTGGGASLQFLEGKALPGVEAIDDLK